MAYQEIEIGIETVVPYPAKELGALRATIQNQGVLKNMADNGIATPAAIRGIAERGTGKLRIVRRLIEYVEKYNQASRA